MRRRRVAVDGPGVLGVLRRRPGRGLLLGSAASGFGDALVPIALSFAVLRLTGSVEALGIAVGLSRAPAVVVTLVGGVASDSYPPRRLALICGLINAVLNLVSAVSVLLIGGMRGAALLIATQVVAVSVGAFGASAGVKLVKLVFPDEEGTRAATVFSNLARNVVHIGAQAVSGLLVLTGSPAVCFVVNAASFLIFVLLLPSVSEDRGQPDGAGPDEGGTKGDRSDGGPGHRPARSAGRAVGERRRGRRRVLAELGEGLRVVRGEPQVAWSLLGSALAWLLIIQPFLILAPAVLQESAPDTAAVRYGAMGACIGIGGVLGGVAAARVRPDDPLPWAAGLGLCDVPLFVVLALWPGSWVMYPLCAATGLQSSLARIWTSQEVYTRFPVQVLGRAQSVLSVGWVLPALLASLCVPSVVAEFGASRTLLLLVAVFVPVVVVITSVIVTAGRRGASEIP